jgi:3-dehydroquinate synthase
MMAELRRSTIPVDLPTDAYVVEVGPGLHADLTGPLSLLPHARKAVVVTTEPVARHYEKTVFRSLESCGLDVDVIHVPDGEEGKTWGVAESILRHFARLPLGRTDLVVALGGGAVCDLGGFVAATWHRGVAVLQLPTTLLAQVDAAIGGKTAVNLPEGKNLVGAFHQPLAVVADTSVLHTLSDRDIRSGLGETAKYGFIDDVTILDLLENSADAATLLDDPISSSTQSSPGVCVRRPGRRRRREGVRRTRPPQLRSHLRACRRGVAAGSAATGTAEAIAIGLVFARPPRRTSRNQRSRLTDRTMELLRRLGLPTGGSNSTGMRSGRCSSGTRRPATASVSCSVPNRATSN